MMTMNYPSPAGRADSSSTDNLPVLALPTLVRAKPIERPRHTSSSTFGSLSSKKTTRTEHYFASSRMINSSTNQILHRQQSITELLACLELHLEAPNSTAKTLCYFLEKLDDILNSNEKQGGPRESRNVIQLVLAAMHKYPEDSTLQCRCLRLLLVFLLSSSTTNITQDLPPNRTVKHVLAAMRNHPTCEQLQCWGGQLLEGLFVSFGHSIFTTFNAEGGMEYVLCAGATSFQMEVLCNRILFYVRAIAQKKMMISERGCPEAAGETTRKHTEADSNLDRLYAGIVVLRLSALESLF